MFLCAGSISPSGHNGAGRDRKPGGGWAVSRFFSRLVLLLPNQKVGSNKISVLTRELGACILVFVKLNKIFRAGCNSPPVVKPTGREADPVKFRGRQYSLDKKKILRRGAWFRALGFALEWLSFQSFLSPGAGALSGSNALNGFVQGILCFAGVMV